MTINQAKVNKLAAEHYNPLYKKHADDTGVKAAALQIVKDQHARAGVEWLDEVQTVRGIRTLIHAMLQEREPVPDPEIKLTDDDGKPHRAHQLVPQLDAHFDEQTAHFQALWQHADALAEEALAAFKKGSSS